MSVGVSVIICCFNSASRITPTLKHLISQRNISPDLWEVIVVDNACTDNTVEVARLNWHAFDGEKPAFKVVSEITPGLSSARKRGIAESAYDYILFCDDDNWLDENYLNIALNIMQSSTAIGALGGTGHPVFEGKEPPYFWVNQYHTLAVGEQSAIDGDITEGRGVLYGAGMVINKVAYDILERDYKFRFLSSDRIGNSLVSSGDHELCLALRQIGYKIYYSKQLNFQHFIPKNRTTIQYYKKLFLGFGLSYSLLLPYKVKKKEVNSLKNDYRYICLRCLKNIVMVNLELVFRGYYFSMNKYKNINLIHSLYRNIGIFKNLIKIKNMHKGLLLNLPLFNNNVSGKIVR